MNLIDILFSCVIWVVLCLILNLISDAIASSSNFNIKLKSKKFVGRLSPIYKLYQENEREYSIKKFEIGYDTPYVSYWVFIIPFLLLFRTKQYLFVDKVLIEIGVDKDHKHFKTALHVAIGNNSIGEKYEEIKSEEKEREELIAIEIKKKENIIDNYNVEFDKNYIE